MECVAALAYLDWQAPQSKSRRMRRLVCFGLAGPDGGACRAGFVQCTTVRVKGQTYACSVTYRPTSAASAIEWKKT